MTGLLADGVRLPLVLVHASVDMLDDIWADRGAEDLGENLGGAGGLAIGADNGDGRSGGHLVLVSGQVCRLQQRSKVSDENPCVILPKKLLKLQSHGNSSRAGVAYLNVGRLLKIREIEASCNSN